MTTLETLVLVLLFGPVALGAGWVAAELGWRS